MNTATANTPDGILTKKRTAHVYVAVVQWRSAPYDGPREFQLSRYTSTLDPAYDNAETRANWQRFLDEVDEVRTHYTWHRAGSKLPATKKGWIRVAVHPVESKEV